MRIMLYSKTYRVSFSVNWKIAVIQVWIPFHLILLEKLFLQVTGAILNMNSGLCVCVCVCVCVLALSPLLYAHVSVSCISLVSFPAFRLFLKNNNMWVQGQHCQSPSCKITPGLTLNYRWQVCQIIGGKTKTKVRRLIFQMDVFGQRAFMELYVKPSLCQVPKNIAIICKKLTVW